MILPILTIPNLILHKKSVDVKKFDKDLNDLILNMVETLYENKGVGLSASQIGKNIKLFVIEYDSDRFESDVTEEDSNIQNQKKPRSKIPLTVLINPKITYFSKETDIEEEGCLSCPGTEIPIERSMKIKVTAQDIDGNRIKIKASGFFARILQHEIDHLSGILIVDKI